MNSSASDEKLINRGKEVWGALIAIAKAIGDENLRTSVCSRLVVVALKRRAETEEDTFFYGRHIQALLAVRSYLEEHGYSSDQYVVSEDLVRYAATRFKSLSSIRQEDFGRILKDNKILINRKLRRIERNSRRIQRTCYLIDKQALDKILQQYEPFIEPDDPEEEAQYYLKLVDRWEKKKKQEEREKKHLLKGDLPL